MSRTTSEAVCISPLTLRQSIELLCDDRVFCDVRRTISIRHLPLGKAQLRSLIMLELMAGGDGRFYISRWEELLQPDDLTALLFLPGAKFVMNGLRSLAAIAASLPSGLFGYTQQASRSDEESTTGLNGNVDHSK
ncbi:hypothetical protein FRC02_004146 [Tulasnella sp. 418]|nr:hypothetical protein FRC02_004146 [Tulasnella sp. 418]